MKTLNEVINEALKVKVKPNVAEKRKVQHAIYKELQRTNSTGRFYRDDNWAGVAKVKEDIDNALYGLVHKTNHEYETALRVERGGYQKTKEGDAQWKEYILEIFIKGHEEPFMTGILNCHAAGTIEDPFSMYDITLQILV